MSKDHAIAKNTETSKTTKSWFSKKMALILQWSKHISYIDGWIPRISLFVPILGYLILFNDQISGLLTFKTITASSEVSWGLTSLVRLQLLYFGLIALGVSNLIFRIRKPSTFTYCNNEHDFIKINLDSMTFHDFVHLYESQKKLLTSDELGVIDKEYSKFVEDLMTIRFDTSNGETIPVERNWYVLRNKHGTVLRQILKAYFFTNNKSRRFALSICLIFSSIGYVLLAIPSLDLFIKVLIGIIK